MIEFSGSNAARALHARLGGTYTLYTFPGAVPEDFDSIPFNLYVDASDAHPIANWKNLDFVSIYNNMQSKIALYTSREDATRFDTVVFNSYTGDDYSLPKHSYYDTLRQAFKHVPNNIASNLVPYHAWANTDSQEPSFNLTDIFWEKSNIGDAVFEAPTDEEGIGFYIECDFGYEAAITQILFEGDSNNNMQPEMLIYTWDSSLNGGTGDWVLFHTHTMARANNTQDIVLPGEIVSTKVRVEWPSMDTNAQYTSLHLLEFLGTEPDPVVDQTEDVTWGLLVPSSPDTGTFKNTVPVPPAALVTVGGPSDSVEMKLTQRKITPGRHHNLLAGRFQFSAQEY